MPVTKECKCGNLYEKWTFNQNKCPKCLIAKQKKIEVSIWNTEKAKIKDGLKTLTMHKDSLQDEVNAIVRLIDKGTGCIATEATNGKMNAGHYISVAANGTIRYNLHDIHLQSEHSNRYLHADTIRYRAGIVRKYGKDYLEFMDSLHQTKTLDLTIPQIRELIPKVRAIKNRLIKEDRIYNSIERIELRNKLNLEIGLYNSVFNP